MATTASIPAQPTGPEPWQRARNHLRDLIFSAANDDLDCRKDIVAAAAGPNLLIAIVPLLKRVSADIDRLVAEGAPPSPELQVRLTDLKTEVAFARFAVFQAGGSL